MRSAAGLTALLLLTACAGSPSAPPSAAAPVPAPAPEAPSEPASPANFRVVFREVVPVSEKEGISSLRIYVSGKKAGATEASFMSEEKTWEGRLPPGNYPLRFVRWRMTSDDTWARDPEAAGLPERFIRIEEGMVTTIRIKYHDLAGRPELSLERSPLPQRDE